MKKLVIGGREFSSRLFVGTGKFSSNDLMQQAILASESEMVTVAMKRVDMDAPQQDDILTHIRKESIQLLPNTSGVRNAEEAVFAAKMAREAFGTNWLKLEIHPDPRYLLPDPVETLRATEQLVKEGFVVLPYCQADPVICKRLAEAGAATVMPLAAPIGTNMGLRTLDFLNIIIDEASVPVVVDAGIGAPSDAAKLTAKDTADVFTGVFISCIAWNPRVANPTSANAGNPSMLTVSTGTQSRTSLAPNIPHWNRSDIISPPSSAIPTVAGIEMHIVKTNPSAYSALKDSNFSGELSFESLGK